MLKIKILFTISVLLVIAVGVICSQNLLIFASTHLAHFSKIVMAHLNIKELSYIAVTIAIIILFSVFSALLNLLKQIKKLNHNINFTQNNALGNTIVNFNRFTQKSENTFDINNLELNPQKLAKEIDELIEDIKEEELQKVEIVPVNSQNQTSSPKISSEKYIQKETQYSVQNISSDPILLASHNIDEQKGFYLVSYSGEKALIGYINDEIFILNKFENLSSDLLKVRLAETIGSKKIYIVKSGRNKSLVQVENEKMKVLLEM